MKFNYYKFAAIFFLGSLLGVYTNCGQPFSNPTDLVFQGNIYGAGTEASYKAFEQTVYPITRANCVSCHTSVQPLHADSNVKTAHDAVISQFKVNFSNIPASRLVAKLRDENHNCWGNCAENAAQMQQAITVWNEAIKSSGVETPKDTGIFTEESNSIEAELMDNTNPLKSNTVKLNIQSALLKAPMALITPAGEDPYLAVPTTLDTTLAATDVNAGVAYMSFKVPASGQYRVWALAHGPVAADNSFFVNVTNGATSLTGGARQFEIPVGTKFEWRQTTITPNLVPNTTYTLELSQREDGARVAAVIITSDASFNGLEVDDYFGKTLTFDLSSILKTPGISLLIDVIDYDLYSYKFSNPRIVSSMATVLVKDMKIYVNDIYSPQHSTYTLVDKIVTPADASLSTYSMIVMKDKGAAGDHVKFSFEKLAISMGGVAGGATGATGGGGSGETSLMAYQSTVYPISRSSAYSCVGCHMAVSPRHASDNAQTAHDAALTVVDFTTPANSRIVNKMKVQRHNCQNYCDDIATQFTNAIQEWKNRRP